MFGGPETKVSSGGGVTAAVAVLGKENEKLYLKIFDAYDKDEEYFESLVYVSIDVLDECKERKATSQDMYLGFLCPVEEFQIYGYMTNTMIKFIIIVSDQHHLHDPELRECFVKLHGAFVDYVMNPFVPLDRGSHSRAIDSTRFDTAIERSVAGLLLKRTAPAVAA